MSTSRHNEESFQDHHAIVPPPRNPSGSPVVDELTRLRGFRTVVRRVDLPDGEHVYVRPLSPGDTLLLRQDDPEAGFKVLALSLATDAGTRLFDRQTLEAGVALVADWPAEYLPSINAALAVLNHSDTDLVEVARRD